jgi:hypothetical protein
MGKQTGQAQRVKGNAKVSDFLSVEKSMCDLND